MTLASSLLSCEADKVLEDGKSIGVCVYILTFYLLEVLAHMLPFQ